MTFAEAYKQECAQRCQWCAKGFYDRCHARHGGGYNPCTAPTLEEFAQQVWERLERAEEALRQISLTHPYFYSADVRDIASNALGEKEPKI